MSVAGPTAAEDLCTAARGLASAAGSEVPHAMPGAERCAPALTLSGSEAWHCAWSFAFRDSTAARHFDALTACFSEAEAVGEDKPVNHPDTHRLRRYRFDGVDFSVSLKDKSAHGRTYVFLGAAPAAD